jgi:hypothetical protein
MSCGRTCFENQDKIKQVRGILPKVYELKVACASAAKRPIKRLDVEVCHHPTVIFTSSF